MSWMTQEHHVIETSLHDGVMRLQLNEPGRLNALSLAMARALFDAIRHAMSTDAARVLLLGGAGTSFCAGKDRKDPATSEFVDALQAIAKELLDGPKPVVAAVQGWAVGAGFELMMDCDIVLAARTSRFVLPETRLGLLGTGAITATLPAAVGLPRAKAMLMLGREFTAAEALQWGLVAQLVDEGHLQHEATQAAWQLAQCDPAVLRQVKRTLHASALGSVGGALARESASHAVLMGARPLA